MTDHFMKGLLVESLLHSARNLVDLGGHDMALLSAIEVIEEFLVFFNLFAVSFSQDLFSSISSSNGYISRPSVEALLHEIADDLTDQQLEKAVDEKLCLS
ncbi:hypothetical protein V3C99_002324 [Haemonchus contortus]